MDGGGIRRRLSPLEGERRRRCSGKPAKEEPSKAEATTTTMTTKKKKTFCRAHIGILPSQDIQKTFLVMEEHPSLPFPPRANSIIVEMHRQTSKTVRGPIGAIVIQLIYSCP
jgi:hypothetical protein